MNQINDTTLTINNQARELSEAIKAARQALGLTQDEAAKRAGMRSAQAWHWYEKGNQPRPKRTVLEAMERALDISDQRLLGLAYNKSVPVTQSQLMPLLVSAAQPQANTPCATAEDVRRLEKLGQQTEEQHLRLQAQHDHLEAQIADLHRLGLSILEALPSKVRASITPAKRRLSRKDSTTGLFNFHYFTNRLDNRLAEVKLGEQFFLLLLDINYLQYYNNNYGHEFGNSVLKTVASILEKHTPDDATLARVLPGKSREGYTGDHGYDDYRSKYGDQFGVIFPVSSENDKAKTLVEIKLLAQACGAAVRDFDWDSLPREKQPEIIPPDDFPIQVTASVVEATAKNKSGSRLLSKADKEIEKIRGKSYRLDRRAPHDK